MTGRRNERWHPHQDRKLAARLVHRRHDLLSCLGEPADIADSTGPRVEKTGPPAARPLTVADFATKRIRGYREVFTLAIFVYADLPAELYARTRKKYWVFGVRPVAE